jgi:hypothetical protein
VLAQDPAEVVDPVPAPLGEELALVPGAGEQRPQLVLVVRLGEDDDGQVRDGPVQLGQERDARAASMAAEHFALTLSHMSQCHYRINDIAHVAIEACGPHATPRKAR